MLQQVIQIKLYHNRNFSVCPDCTKADVAETAVAVTTIDDNILRLCSLSDEELVHAKGNSRLSWVSLSMAKEMSSRLNLNKSHNKGELIDNIIAKRNRVNELSVIHAADDEEDCDVESKDFKSNQNTFPRLCNIILNCPDAVVSFAGESILTAEQGDQRETSCIYRGS